MVSQPPGRRIARKSRNTPALSGQELDDVDREDLVEGSADVRQSLEAAGDEPQAAGFDRSPVPSACLRDHDCGLVEPDNRPSRRFGGEGGEGDAWAAAELENAIVGGDFQKLDGPEIARAI